MAEAIDVVVNDWAALKPYVTAVLAGEKLSKQDRAYVFHGMNKMTGNMNTAVGHYADASKLGI